MLSSFIFVSDKLIILQQTDLLKKYICKERIFSSKKNPDLFLSYVRVLGVQFPSDVTGEGGGGWAPRACAVAQSVSG